MKYQEKTYKIMGEKQKIGLASEGKIERNEKTNEKNEKERIEFGKRNYFFDNDDTNNLDVILIFPMLITQKNVHCSSECYSLLFMSLNWF